MKARADGPRDMAPHGQIRLQQDAEITHRGRGPYRGPTDIQRVGVEMKTPSASRAPQKVRLLGVESQSVAPHPFSDPLNAKLHSSPLLLDCRWRSPRVELRVVGINLNERLIEAVFQ